MNTFQSKHYDPGAEDGAADDSQRQPRPRIVFARFVFDLFKLVAQEDVLEVRPTLKVAYLNVGVLRLSIRVLLEKFEHRAKSEDHGQRKNDCHRPTQP